ncbi:MAG: response regulator [Dehalococcoidales bacterium]|nr:response regulator [Dehalococcoidales bacterium]
MSRKPQILVIDSEPDFLREVREVSGNNFELIFAYNADEALETAKKNKPDVIILGYLKPQGTSFELHLKLRKNRVTTDIPILVVDVCLEEHSRKGWTREQGKRMKANDYISKPVAPHELGEIIKRLIAKNSSENMDISTYMERVLQQIKTIENSLSK